jgi:hypothetical protein
MKAMIAYSGTAAVGKAALFYYQTGKKATPEQIREAFNESTEEAKNELIICGLNKDLLKNHSKIDPSSGIKLQSSLKSAKIERRLARLL